MSQQPELIESLRAEAIVLMHSNQTMRRAAQRTMAGMFALVAGGTLLGIAVESQDVVIVMPPAVLLLASLMFQQYSEVTVLGAARAALERRLAEELGAGALIYETSIAPIRKRPPLVHSVRMLQGLTGATIAVLIATGTVVVFEDGATIVQVAFVVFTLGGLLSAGASYRDMLRSGSVAFEAFGADLATQSGLPRAT